MELTVGSIVDGKVTGIMKFGAFVSLPEGRSGLVHISEIAYTYVSEVSDYLQVGQEVKVKIIGIDPNGRINLSIKKTADPPARPNRRSAPPSSPAPGPAPAPRAASFEDKLKQFMQDSDSRLSGVRQYSERSSRRRGNRGGNYGDYDD
jgi:S1 RNA binding domain protein